MLIPTVPVSWYAVLALSVALVAAAVGLKHQYVQNGVQADQIRTLNSGLKAASEQRALNAATLDRLAKKNAATARETASLKASLGAALRAQPDWANTPVPKEVQDALRKP